VLAEGIISALTYIRSRFLVFQNLDRSDTHEQRFCLIKQAGEGLQDVWRSLAGWVWWERPNPGEVRVVAPIRAQVTEDIAAQLVRHLFIGLTLLKIPMGTDTYPKPPIHPPVNEAAISAEFDQIPSTLPASPLTTIPAHWTTFMSGRSSWPRFALLHSRRHAGRIDYPLGVITGVVETMGESGEEGKVTVEGLGGSWLDSGEVGAERMVSDIQPMPDSAPC
jgi:hypothetical protein